MKKIMENGWISHRSHMLSLRPRLMKTEQTEQTESKDVESGRRGGKIGGKLRKTNA